MRIKSSRSRVWFLLLCTLAPAGAANAQQKIFPASAVAVRGPAAVTGYVDPFIGTAASDVPTRWGSEGGCYPGAVAVSGFFQLTPETRRSATKGYDYRDSVLLAFSCLNHNSGFPNGSAGSLFVMPVTDTSFNLFSDRRPFSHRNEVAEPGYYRVCLTDDSTIVEATATTRTGFFRMHFAIGRTPFIFIGNDELPDIINDSTLAGGTGNLWMRFNRPFHRQRTVPGGIILIFYAAPAAATEITLRMSASAVGIRSAEMNAVAESGDRSFDSVRAGTQRQWQDALSVVEVRDTNNVAKKILYTALYHSLLVPWVISDVNGTYHGRDGRLHQASGPAEYDNFSPWDTWRTLDPLRSLLYPALEQDVALSLLDIYRQTKRLPVESMTGNHAIPILADAFFKGLLPESASRVFEALRSNVEDSPFVQRDMGAYRKKGYLPAAWPESVTRTVEYGYDDWVLARFAQLEIHDSDAYRRYRRRSMAYRKLFDPAEGLLVPRIADTARPALVSPRPAPSFIEHAGTTGYKEGDAWVYTFFAPHDTRGLSNLLGGNARFNRVLDSALRDGRICFDNETAFHIPWLFNETGAPGKTDEWVDRLRRERFHATPGGLPGNDDLGATSGWYVWSVLGLYPLTPGFPAYTIASPGFRDIVLHLRNKKNLRLIRSGDLSSPRLQALTWNHRPLDAPVITHALLAGGGELRFITGGRLRLPLPAGFYRSHFSETGRPAAFHLSRITVPGKPVRPDEPFWISFTVSNSGSSGSVVVSVTEGNRLAGSACLLLDAGGARRDSVLCRCYRPGWRRLLLNGTGRAVVSVWAGGKKAMGRAEVSGLEVAPLVPVATKARLSFSVKNTGSAGASFTLPVSVNDSIVARLTVFLAPGAGRQLQTELTAPDTGSRQVRVLTAVAAFRTYNRPGETVMLDLVANSNTTTNGLVDVSDFHQAVQISSALSAQTDSAHDGLRVGDGRYAEITGTKALDQMGNTLSMMLWVFPLSGRAGLADIFSKGDHHVIQVSGSETLTFFAGGWGRGDCTIPLPADWTDHWHHVAGVCDGNTLKVYLDGDLAGTTRLEDTVSLTVENHWNLGRNEEFPGIRMFSGYVNHARVFYGALSVTEIKEEMNRLRPLH